MINNLNIKLKSQVVQENIGLNFHDLEFGSGFLDI